jgi:hypothetical protein
LRPHSRSNGAGIVGCCRAFVLFCCRQGLFAGAIAAIDGSKVRAATSRKRIVSSAEAAAAMARPDQAITAHLPAMDAADAAEPDEADGQTVKNALAVARAGQRASPASPRRGRCATHALGDPKGVEMPVSAGSRRTGPISLSITWYRVLKISTRWPSGSRKQV